MLSLTDQVVRDLSALYGFVEAVSSACVPPPRNSAFTEPSERFFDHIEHLAEKTKLYLSSFPVDTDGTEEDFQDSRKELSTIRSAWRELHQFIKPAVDADTLNQPTALVEGIIHRLRQIPQWQATDFTIFQSDSFDYLQVNPSSIREIASGLASIVGANNFPPDVGLIGIPNSQGNALFLNCLVAHEVAHYVFDEGNVRGQLLPEVEAALTIHVGSEYTEKNPSERSFLNDMVTKWATELFCDLLAVQLVGPCYTFAYIELYDLVGLLDRAGDIAKEKLKSQIKFYPDHPSHPFRVKHQADLLKGLDWWRHIASIDSRHIRLLSALLEVPDGEFASHNGDRKPYVEAFLAVLPAIRTALGSVTGTLDAGVYEFGLLAKSVCLYLENGIVPSTLNIQTTSGTTQEVTPSTVTLLNAAFCFYLERVEDLMSIVKGQDLKSLARRAYWVKRIEGWTFKALEDIHLVKGGS